MAFRQLIVKDILLYFPCLAGKLKKQEKIKTCKKQVFML